MLNIEEKRNEMERYLNREETRARLEREYRGFSKKGAFTCLCCGKPVNMNLTKEAGRPFFFKHNDESECSYSENTRTYQQHVKKLENSSKKQIGIAVFGEILNGELKPYKARIERGFQYRNKLSFVPDFIVTFPDSEELWAIDFFTSLNRGVKDGHYARDLEKRMKTYEEEGFKPFSFVDSSWLTYRVETSLGSLMKSEERVALKREEDIKWDRFLHSRLKGPLYDYFKKITRANIEEFDTKSIVYVDLDNRLCEMFQWIPVSRDARTTTFYKLTSSNLPLAQALSLNTEQSGFQLSALNEDEERIAFLDRLIAKQSADETIKKQFEEKKLYVSSLVQREAVISSQESDALSDDEVERRMAEVAKVAQMRPPEYSAEEWEYEKRLRQRRHIKKQNAHLSKTLDPLKKKKEKKVQEILLMTSIKGEVYIEARQEKWRQLIIDWLNENQYENQVEIRVSELISYMKANGITFNQHDQIIKYPISNFLNLYEKTMWSLLRDRIKIIIVE